MIRLWAARLSVVLGATLAAIAPAEADGDPHFADRMEAKRLESERSRLADAGRSEELIPVAEKLLALREKLFPADDPQIVEAERVLGYHLGATGQYARAIEVYTRAQRSIERAGRADTREYRLTLRAIGKLYSQQGDRERAEPIFARLLSKAQADGGPDGPSVPESLVDLGVLRRDLGDPAGAEPLLVQALAVIRRRGDRAVISVEDSPEHGVRDVSPAPLAGESDALLELGRTYGAMGDPARASASFDEALRLDEALGEDGARGAAVVLDDLGVLRMNAGDLAGARSALGRSLAMREKNEGPEHGRVAVALHHLARLGMLSGDAAGAEALARRALGIALVAYGPEHRRTADVRMDLAMALAAEGRASEAIPIAATAADTHDRDAARVLTTGSERQKRSIAAELRYATDAVVSLHLDRAPSDPAAARLALTVILRRKGRVLDAMTDGISAVRAHLPEAGRALLDRLTAVSSHLSARTALAGDKPRPEDRALLASLEAERRSIEAEISARSAAFQVEEGLFGVDDAARALPEKTALVELFAYRPFRAGRSDPWGPPRYAAYVLARGGAIAGIDLGEAAAIDGAAARLRKALGDPDLTHDPKPAARELEALVFEPLRAHLGAATTILLSPDGALDLVPFGALVDPGGRWLVERWLFTYLDAGRDVLRTDFGAPRGGPLVLANPAFGPLPDAAAIKKGAPGPRLGFVPLPGSVREAAAVMLSVQGASILVGDGASEAAVKAVHGPRVLHIASHGFFLPPPPSSPARGPTLAPTPAELASALSAPSPLLRAGLALAGANEGGEGGEDGILTALEVSALDLYGTRLVVLSACETGVGDAQAGEGVYGLRRALTMAGAETQVLSLWEVDTGATRALMQRFYASLAGGRGPSEAMRSAELGMLADPRTAHPNLWGAFIVSGSGRPIDGGGSVGKVEPGPRGCACSEAPGGAGEGWAALAELGIAVVAARATTSRDRRRRALFRRLERFM